jgi:hypothetical protein
MQKTGERFGFGLPRIGKAPVLQIEKEDRMPDFLIRLIQKPRMISGVVLQLITRFFFFLSKTGTKLMQKQETRSGEVHRFIGL